MKCYCPKRVIYVFLQSRKTVSHLVSKCSLEVRCILSQQQLTLNEDDSRDIWRIFFHLHPLDINRFLNSTYVGKGFLVFKLTYTLGPPPPPLPPFSFSFSFSSVLEFLNNLWGLGTE
jgi:hypothetical protein